MFSINNHYSSKDLWEYDDADDVYEISNMPIVYSPISS